MVLIVGLASCAAVRSVSGNSWREEVLLHDGSRIIVTRWQSYGGAHEIGQRPAVKEHSISFDLPKSGKHYKWTSEYGVDERWLRIFGHADN
ncbi:MAG TPA: hypothetical protein VFA81_00605 [Burkholderiales bacterium]|nr:hypothetical protein [Burkholderiales bacterium]